MSEHRLPEPDRPWVMRTYAGHSDARRSNELYRRNLAKGQTGLSVAFDLPTQTGYDPDHILARGEVGKVGVSIAHKGDMHALFDGIPLGEMNTSMTINATAAWLLGLYVTVADENGVDRAALKGTTQNDIIKEYLSRGTYAFPPGPSMRLIADTVAFSVNEIPSWNPTNVCSYHLQEAGATPVQEIAYALSTAIAVLDEVKARGQVAEDDFPKVFGRISFFVNAGVRFVEEHAKLRAMGEMWEWIGRNRYGVTDPKLLRMRYGVQVNSLGLTEAQPENNVQRIVLEALAVTLGRNARARAIQLPAWNEALGLPRPWDQQWSLRIQQVLAFETDLLEYPDIFEGSKVMDGLVDELVEGAKEEMKIVADQGGRGRRRRLHEGAPGRVAPRADRPDRARGDQGRRPELLHRDRGLAADRGRRRRHPHPRPRGRARAPRGARGVEGRARPGGGRGGARRPRRRRARRERQHHAGDDRRREGGRDDRRVGADAARRVRRLPGAHRRLGRRRRRQRGAARRDPRPGRRARRADRAPPADPGRQAGPRRPLQRRRADRGPRPRRRHGGDLPGDPADPGADRRLGARRGRRRGRPLDPLRLAPGADPRDAAPAAENEVDAPVVVGGIIPAADAAKLREAGVAAVFTPKDFDVNRIMGEIVDLVGARAGSPAPA